MVGAGQRLGQAQARDCGGRTPLHSGVGRAPSHATHQLPHDAATHVCGQTERDRTTLQLIIECVQWLCDNDVVVANNHIIYTLSPIVFFYCAPYPTHTTTRIQLVTVATKLKLAPTNPCRLLLLQGEAPDRNS